MDGIMTGEQVWRARVERAQEQGVEGHGAEGRMSIPRALREADRAAGERKPGDGGPGLLRRMAKGWLRGWMAFVATAGNPYLSLAGHLPGSGDEGAARPAGDGEEGTEGKDEGVEEVGRCA